MKTVFIVEDNALIREGIIRIVRKEKGLSVCGGSGYVEDSFEAVSNLKPDMVIINLSLKSGDGLTLVKKIKMKLKETSVLTLSTHGEFFYAERTLSAESNGYLLKEDAVENIGAAIHKILNGEKYLSEKMKSTMLTKYVFRHITDDSSIHLISSRETEVFRFIGKGLGTAEIAQKLHISLKTVESHCLHIKRNLGIKKITELTHKAFQWIQREKMK